MRKTGSHRSVASSIDEGCDRQHIGCAPKAARNA
jgi:hypothetical protein